MTWNPLDIYARAARRLKLTPGERALLKTADTLLLAGLAGGAVAVLQALVSGGAPLSLQTLWHVFLYAAATALVTGVAKLFRASGDSAFVALGGAIEGVASRLPAPPAQPLTQPYSPRSGGGVPSGPLTGPLATARQERLAALSGAGYRNFASGGDPSTRPTAAVSAATSAPKQPLAQQTPVESSPTPVATPAPSQPQTQQLADAAPASDEDNGPPTVRMPAVTAMAQAVKADGWTR